jgi:hypothetical protein
VCVLACAFHGLTSVVLPFTTPTQSPPILDPEALEMLRVAQPQVLILQAGLAVDSLNAIKSLKEIIVVDNTTGSQMDWGEEDGQVPTKTWDALLENKATFPPLETLPTDAIAVETFENSPEGYKSIKFTHQVTPSSLSEGVISDDRRMSLLQWLLKSKCFQRIKLCPKRTPFCH